MSAFGSWGQAVVCACTRMRVSALADGKQFLRAHTHTRIRAHGARRASAVVLVLTANAATATELVRHELRVPGAVQRVLAEDLDGDERPELLVFSVAGERRPTRHVSVFALAAAGPALRSSWELDPEAGMVDLGRDPTDGPSLWYCTASAVRRYRLREALGRAPSPETWLEAPSLLGGRSDEWILFHDFARDWRGDGAETPAVFEPGRVLLPRRDAALPGDVLDLHTEIDLTELPASYELLPRMPLIVTHRVPALTRVDADGDGRADIVTTLGDRLEVHRGAADGSYARSAQRAVRLPSPASPRDETRRQGIQLADVTGDGRVDAVLGTITGGLSNLRQVTEIFPATGDGFATAPSASLDTQGAATVAVLEDLDGDGRQELTTVSVTIGVAAVLRFLLTRSMTIEYATYAVDPQGRLGETPLLQWTQPVRLDLDGPGDPGVVTLAGDFDADGVRDIVSAQADDSIEIRRLVRGPDGLALGDVIAEAKAPGRGQAVTTDLDRDGRSDLIVYAPRARAGVVTVFLTRLSQ